MNKTQLTIVRIFVLLSLLFLDSLLAELEMEYYVFI